MSTSTVALNTGQFAIINADTGKIFIWMNRSDAGVYTNPSGTPAVLPAGTLMGRVGATQKLLPLASAAVDGSQFPIGVLMDDYTVAGNATVNVFICVAGDVVEEKVILQGADTLATLVSARSIRDRIGSDTVGIKLVPTTELTNFDNQ